MQEKLQANKEKCREIAERLYELDGEVYDCVGSALGRTFTGDRENCIRSLAMLMYTKPDGHLLRSEMALISNTGERSEKASYDKIRRHSSGSGGFAGYIRFGRYSGSCKGTVEYIESSSEIFGG